MPSILYSGLFSDILNRSSSLKINSEVLLFYEIKIWSCDSPKFGVTRIVFCVWSCWYPLEIWRLSTIISNLCLRNFQTLMDLYLNQYHHCLFVMSMKSIWKLQHNAKQANAARTKLLIENNGWELLYKSKTMW